MCVNGETTEKFKAKRGIRQGDPLSPYIFVIVIEYMQRILKHFNNPNFNFYPHCEKLGFLHLCFVDNLHIFSRVDKISVCLLNDSFEKSADATTLKANLAKYQI